MKRVLFLIAFLASVAFSQTSSAPVREYLIGKTSYIDFLKCSKIEGDLSNLRCDFQMVNNGKTQLSLYLWAAHSNYFTKEGYKYFGESIFAFNSNKQESRIESLPGTKISFSVDFSVFGPLKTIPRLDFTYATEGRAGYDKKISLKNVKISNPDQFVSYWSEYISVKDSPTSPYGYGRKFRWNSCNYADNVSFNLSCKVSYINLTDEDLFLGMPRAQIILEDGTSIGYESVKIQDEVTLFPDKNVTNYSRSRTEIEYNFNAPVALKSIKNLMFRQVQFENSYSYDLNFTNVNISGVNSRKSDFIEGYGIPNAFVSNGQALKFRLEKCSRDIREKTNLTCNVLWINPTSKDYFYDSIYVATAFAFKLIDTQGKAHSIKQFEIDGSEISSDTREFNLKVPGLSSISTVLRFSIPEDVRQFRELRIYDAQLKGKIQLP